MGIFGLPKALKTRIRNPKKRTEALELFLQLLRTARKFPADQQQMYYKEIRSSFKKCKNEKNPKVINQNIIDAKTGLAKLSNKYMDYLRDNPT